MRTRVKRQLIVKALQAIALGSMFAACQSIPDVSPWSDSTRQIADAVVGGFRTSARVNGEIARRAAPEFSKNQAFGEASRRYERVAIELLRRADDYEIVFGAIVDYSTSLRAISGAANDSATTADGVANALNALVGSLGATALAGPAFDLLKELGGEVLKIKAARDFQSAVETADPSIGRLADIVKADLDELTKTIGQTKDEALRIAFYEPREHEIEFYRRLEQRRKTIQDAVRQAMNSDGSVSVINIADAPELARLDQYLAAADVWYRPLTAELNTAVEARAATEALAIQTRKAIGVWRESHAYLSKAISEHRAPSAARLSSIAAKLREVIADIDHK